MLLIISQANEPSANVLMAAEERVLRTADAMHKLAAMMWTSDRKQRC
jgi:hypothetical protein